MEDEAIVDLFWQRSEEAIVQTDRKYGRYCRAVAYNILQNEDDCDECLNDTYLRTWNTIPPKRPTFLSAFLARITRNLALDRQKFFQAEKRGGGQIPLVLEELAECIPGGTDAEEILENKAITEALNRFLRSLPQRTREIFMLRYWYLCCLKKIAEIMALRGSNVKMTLLRARHELKTLLEKEGVSV